jgi:protein-L-isoaspartate(D-aspartate) O-methyltransferase
MSWVDIQLRARGISDSRVLEAMQAVPRAAFVPDALQHEAHADSPLPIGGGQTISQPYVVAWMTQELRVAPGQRVLEIGTGSGYQTAILAALGAIVYTIEIREELSARAERVLTDLHYTNIQFRVGSGYDGWPEAAPFDRILLTAAPPELPPALLDQLADDGRLIAPIGDADSQVMTVVEKHDGEITTRTSIAVRFVPLVHSAART